MICELCGKEAQLFKTEIEGTQLNVCKDCAKFGNILEEVKEKKVEIKTKVKKKEPGDEIIEIVVSDFAQKIKNRREKLKLKQEELAKKLGIKESLLHHIESGKFMPSIELAKRIEKFLKIKLVEEYIETGMNIAKGETAELTIGDIVELKRK